MSARWLLALYPKGWQERYGAELSDLLERERLTPWLLVDLVRGAADAHLHPELIAPLLAAAGGGTLQAPPRGPRVGAYVLIVVLLLLLVYGGLYAYRSQAPAVMAVPMTQAVSQVQAGQVVAIEFTAAQATITLLDGTHERTTVNAQNDLRSSADEYNRTHPGSRIRIAYRPEGNAVSTLIPAVASFLLTILPLALLALLIVLLSKRLSQGRGRAEGVSRYEWVARIADLRDRGVLTEEEFQREKKRLLE